MLIINLTHETKDIINNEKIGNLNELPKGLKSMLQSTNSVWIRQASIDLYKDNQIVYSCMFTEYNNKIYLTNMFSKSGKLWETNWQFFND